MDDDTPGQDESGPLQPAWVGEGLAPDEEYSPAKVACEQQCWPGFPATWERSAAWTVPAGPG